jgi:hypothetical protein
MKTNLKNKMEALEAKFEGFASLRVLTFEHVQQNAISSNEEIINKCDPDKQELKIADFLNRTRLAQLHELEIHMREMLADLKSKTLTEIRPNMKRYFAVNTHRRLLTKLNLFGTVAVRNEPPLNKRIQQFLFYPHMRSTKITNFKTTDKYKLVAIKLINSNRLFYHFKSLDNKRDLLVTTTSLGLIQSWRLVDENNHRVNSSEYAINDQRIVGVVSDYAFDTHRLTFYDFELNETAAKRYDTLVSLVLVTNAELVLYTPLEYVVLDFRFKEIKRMSVFNQSLVGSLSIKYYTGMVGASDRCFYFRMNDYSQNKDSLIVADRFKGRVKASVDLARNEEIRIWVDRARGKGFLIRRVGNTISCVDLDSLVDERFGKQRKQRYESLKVLTQMDISADDFLYSINYIKRTIHIL